MDELTEKLTERVTALEYCYKNLTDDIGEIKRSIDKISD